MFALFNILNAKTNFNVAFIREKKSDTKSLLLIWLFYVLSFFSRIFKISSDKVVITGTDTAFPACLYN